MTDSDPCERLRKRVCRPARAMVEGRAEEPRERKPTCLPLRPRRSGGTRSSPPRSVPFDYLEVPEWAATGVTAAAMWWVCMGSRLMCSQGLICSYGSTGQPGGTVAAVGIGSRNTLSARSGQPEIEWRK